MWGSRHREMADQGHRGDGGSEKNGRMPFRRYLVQDSGVRGLFACAVQRVEEEPRVDRSLLADFFCVYH